jgi:ssRNA-specific RNase YbeY (16S rRNA maturation enzyme)
MKTVINITNTQRKLKINQKSVRYIVKNSIEKLYCGSYEIDIIFCSENYIKKLNRLYRNQDKATDVLSFEIKEQVGDIFYIGEIYIAPSTAEKNFIRYRNFWEKDDWVDSDGKEGQDGQEENENPKNRKNYCKKGLDRELALLIIHGILHLFGYAHDEEHKLDLDDPGYDKEMKYMQNFLYKEL